jgi:hypothetical protein
MEKIGGRHLMQVFVKIPIAESRFRLSKGRKK